MNIQTLTVVTVLTSTFLLTAVMAAQTSDERPPYKIQYLQDCTVVSEKVMTEQQTQHYLQLQDEQRLMDELQRPIKAIEQQIQQYSQQIDELTVRAIQEDDATLHINKVYLQQQKEVAGQLNSLISEHQQDFDALEVQGRNIQLTANKFEAAIKQTQPDLEFGQIRIIGPSEQRSGKRCLDASLHASLRL